MALLLESPGFCAGLPLREQFQAASNLSAGPRRKGKRQLHSDRVRLSTKPGLGVAPQREIMAIGADRARSVTQLGG